ncbi:hypothetical protein B0T19DRAFT_416086 [Cercophora scortea]|uniref:Uncharacterized protein n=1 Tax=Cercophora scortea TaxID=314031 RepID=A0AAE0MHP8_9PEZI|nr:hypothetical protein B0T19DRAFT_416086 [Cercophora scortea]
MVPKTIAPPTFGNFKPLCKVISRTPRGQLFGGWCMLNPVSQASHPSQNHCLSISMSSAWKRWTLDSRLRRDVSILRNSGSRLFCGICPTSIFKLKSRNSASHASHRALSTSLSVHMVSSISTILGGYPVSPRSPILCLLCLLLAVTVSWCCLVMLRRAIPCCNLFPPDTKLTNRLSNATGSTAFGLRNASRLISSSRVKTGCCGRRSGSR